MFHKEKKRRNHHAFDALISCLEHYPIQNYKHTVNQQKLKKKCVHISKKKSQLAKSPVCATDYLRSV
jgi:hypothetical protein